jgi:hypothetical protein
MEDAVWNAAKSIVAVIRLGFMTDAEEDRVQPDSRNAYQALSAEKQAVSNATAREYSPERTEHGCFRPRGELG